MHAPEFRYQTGGRRFLAFVIDGFLLTGLRDVLAWLFQLDLWVPLNVAIALVFCAVTPGYHIYMHARFGQTLGKWIARVRVVGAYWVAIAWVLLEYLTMLLNEQRRAIHDFIAGTVVVRVD
jgi:uncharacterized RDD family membrane protein YckC